MNFSSQIEDIFKQDLISQFDANRINAEVIADSISPAGKRITTLKIQFPRIILAEINTHRAIAKCCSSSRAIPAKKLRQRVMSDPFVPVYFGSNRSGMAATESLTGWKKRAAIIAWKSAGICACGFHWMMEKIGLHKQICNRIIEPWLYITSTITSTEWENFFKLRYSSAAQPEIIILAKCIHDAIAASDPKQLKEGEVHLPWIDDEELKQHGIENCIKISVARCARSSYENNLGKKSQPEEDLKLYDRLLSGGHFSAFEHIATPINQFLNDDYERNFRGWDQYRAFVDHPCEDKFLG